MSDKRENWSEEVESPTATHDQKSKFQKFKMADFRHFENGLSVSRPTVIQFREKFGVQMWVLIRRMVK